MTKNLISDIISTFLIMGVMYIAFVINLNVFPIIKEFSFSPNLVISSLKNTDIVMNESRNSFSEDINESIVKYVNKNTDISSENYINKMIEKSDQYKKKSLKMNNFVKKIIGNNKSLYSKLFTMDEDVLFGREI